MKISRPSSRLAKDRTPIHRIAKILGVQTAAVKRALRAIQKAQTEK